MFINIDSMLQNTKESDSRVSHQMHESGLDLMQGNSLNQS